MTKPTFLLLLILGIFLLNACTEKDKKKKETPLTVAAAANVQFAMKAIEKGYESDFDKKIRVIIGSSGKLTAQIIQGAPYDLLISANRKYPEKLYQDGYATAPPKIYALGSLVLWTMKNDLKLTDNLSALTQSSIAKIGIANPKNAPYGEQAMNAFTYFGLLEKIRSKLVYGENVAQVNQYILTQNCEVGLTAKSVVSAPEMQGKGHWTEIYPKAYQPIEQGVVITKYGIENHAENAQQFYDFLFSEKAANIFKEYGYSIPEVE